MHRDLCDLRSQIQILILLKERTLSLSMADSLLHLIGIPLGRDGGARFSEQSQSEVKHNKCSFKYFQQLDK